MRRSTLIGLAVAAVVLTGAAAGLLLPKSESQTAGETIEIVVPSGTQDKIGAGEDPKLVDDRVVATVGDRLRIVNNDDSLHVVIGYPVSAGQTTEAQLRRAGSFQTDCSIHKDQSVVLEVREP